MARILMCLCLVYLNARNALSAMTKAEEEDMFAQISLIQSLSLRLQRLSRSSVLNDVFHIWFDGHFGCINGLRMGRLSSGSVSFTKRKQPNLIIFFSPSSCGLDRD